MERINYKGRSIGRIDESSLVKAAAWAWYQHGSSGSLRESCLRMQEYHDVSSRKTKKAPRPSRYKLEAMKQVQEKSDKVSQLSCHVHVQDYEDGPNSLLDSYEIDRISRDLDCYIAASHAKNCQNLCCHYKTRSSRGSGARSISHVRSKTESIDVFCKNKGKSQGVKSSESDEMMKIKLKDKKSPRGAGFIVRGSRVVCGARLDDVVDVRVRNGGTRWPEKHVAVVSVVTCRPRGI